MSILYHYCTAETLVSIVRSRSIWLSSLTLSNDTMEGRLVSRTVMELAIEDGLNGYPLQRLKDSIGAIEEIFDGLGFCLSEDGDLLSQWRGYADDASGVSIGFSRDYLETLSSHNQDLKNPKFTLKKVEYDPEAQRATLTPTYNELRNLIDVGVFVNPGISSLLDTRSEEDIRTQKKIFEEANIKFLIKLFELSPKLFSLKSNAFREEREWRLVSSLFKGISDDCEYRAAAGRIIPYRSLDLVNLETPVIVDVILGPRHPTPPQVISAMLKHYGFDGVHVRPSVATYR